MQTASGSRLSKVLWAFGIFAAMAASFVLGLIVGRPAQSLAAISQNGLSATSVASLIGVYTNPPSDIELPTDFKQFWDLWRRLKENYYKQPVDEKKMFYGAMSGLAASLGDPYTVFFEPKTAQEFSDSLQGKFEGIGAEIGIRTTSCRSSRPCRARRPKKRVCAPAITS